MLANLVKVISKYHMVFLSGLGNTLWISAVSIVFGTMLGIFIAFGKLSKKKPLNLATSVYVEILRGTPLLLQLYFFWLGLPYIFPKITDLTCVLIALIVNASAYVAECIRAGIEAVDGGQREAAVSLGMTEENIMWKVIFPQAIKNILPALGNEFIVMIKESSMASIFFIGELMTSFKIVQSNMFLAIEPLTVVGLIYLTVTIALTRFLKYFERRLKAND